MNRLALKLRKALIESKYPIPTNDLVNAFAINLSCGRQQVSRDLQRLVRLGLAKKITLPRRPGRAGHMVYWIAPENQRLKINEKY
jgi:predicted transcriptional regulator